MKLTFGLALDGFRLAPGAVEFTQAAKQAGLKPILGATVLVEGQPARLYVQTTTGYHNLCRLLTTTTPHAESEDDPTEPRQVHLRLSQLDGLDAGLLAVGTDTRLSSVFDDRFYRAVSSLEEAKATSGSRCVAVLPVHYAERDDRWKWNIVQSIRTRTLLRQAHPGKLLDGDFHLRTPAEMTTIFRDFPDVVTNTLELAERCPFELPLSAPQFPVNAG